MERKGRIFGIILILALISTGCSPAGLNEEKEIRINFTCGIMPCKADDPDENKISDVSLMIFDETGSAEECIWLSGGRTECSSRLVMNKKYIFCACANFGYQVYVDDMEELQGIRYHMAYPDEYSQGIPMYACQEVTIGEGCGEISVRLERLMAKISLQMDRRKLSENVEMYVRSVQVGNCPRSASVFEKNKVSDEDDCFPAGFSRYGLAADPLNRTTGNGSSGSISLYMLENMQGSMDEHISGDEEKVFGKEDHRRNVCSYIEMELEYISDEFYSGKEGLIYRFYLGESRNDLNIERNCHYRITVTPEDDGLSDDGWRVDKTDLHRQDGTWIKGYPSSYINGDIGDEIHIWCEFSPLNAVFDVGESYMEYDQERGIYDYEIDKDGHGATLTLKNPGTGLIYMEAGEPINDAVLFIIEANLP